MYLQQPLPVLAEMADYGRRPPLMTIEIVWAPRQLCVARKAKACCALKAAHIHFRKIRDREILIAGPERVD